MPTSSLALPVVAPEPLSSPPAPGLDNGKVAAAADYAIDEEALVQVAAHTGKMSIQASPRWHR